MRWYRYIHGVKDIMFYSPNENICTIARMKDIHYLFYITSKIYFERAVSGHRSVPLHGTIQRSLYSVSISYQVTLYHPIK